MTDKRLDEMLAKIKAPEPEKDSKNNAVNASVAAFEKIMQERTQGKVRPARLTGVKSKTTFNIGRLLMKRSFVLSGMTGAVAVCALLVFVGGPLSQRLAETNMAYTTDTGLTGSIEQQAEALKANTATSVSSVADAKGKQSVVAEQVPAKNDADSALQNRVVTPSVSAMAPAAEEWRMKKEAEVERGRMASSELSADESKVSGGEVPSSVVASPVMGYLASPSSAPERAAGAKVANMPASSPAPTQGMIMNMVAPVVDQLQPNYYQDVGRDKFKDFEENQVKQVAEQPVSTFSIDVDTSSYSFVRRQINSGLLPQKDAVRVEEMINYFDYNYPLPETKAQPFKPTIAVTDSPWHKGHKLVQIGIKGHDIAPSEARRTNLVFLIDTSGSMNSPDKLPLLVNSLKMLLDQLKPDDTVGIVTYAGSAGTALEPTKVSDKGRIVQALESLGAGGSTAGAEGIRQAYNLAESRFDKEGVNRVILATDGDFNVGITNPEELKDFVERKRETGIFLSVLGFGQGNYNDAMMQTLAQNGNGTAAYIDTLNEARKVLVDEASSTLYTIAKDVKIQVEFNPGTVSEYRLIGYETRMLNREDFNNDKIDAGEVGSGAAVTAIYEITPKGVTPTVDGLRYQPEQKIAEKKEAAGNANEYGFLKIRYKLPDESTSKLIEQPIAADSEKTLDAQSDDVRFATAVASFGQILKGGKYTGTISYDAVIDLANGAKGADPFGYRAEFINLVRLAKSAAALQTNR